MRQDRTIEFVTGVFPNLESALQVYQAVEDLYFETNVMDAFDAAVIGKQDTGSVKIFKSHGQPAPHGGLAGVGWGLASGVVVALFPAAALGMNLQVDWTGACAGLSALAGHISTSLGRENMLELGQLIDSSDASVVVAASADMVPQVGRVMGRAGPLEYRSAVLDQGALERAVRDAYREAGAW